MTTRRLRILLALLCLLANGEVLSAASPSDETEGDWLVGTWQGNVETMRVFAVSREGVARGTWAITGQREVVARIRLQRSRITVITSDGNSVELVHGQQGDQLAGTITYKSGQTSPLTLTRVNGASDLASLNLQRLLIGHWEGEVKFVGINSVSRNRTLYIDSVNHEDTQWVGRGRFGITGKRLASVRLEVDVSGDAHWIRFMWGSNLVRLQVFSDNLIGSMRFPGTDWGPPQFIEPSMHLERVE
jgi:hypothetical protein